MPKQFRLLNKNTLTSSIKQMIISAPFVAKLARTGMCGGCKVTVGGQTKFACVDGPDFDANKVDFRQLMNRLQTYQKEENFEGNTV